MRTPKVNIAPGFVSGRLTVIRRGSKSDSWLCRCSCGKEREVREGNLRSGHSQSCSCRRVEAVVAVSTRHGHAAGGPSPEYEAWVGMKKVCSNPNRENFEYFGGKGIKVCPAWENSFEQFLADISSRPAGHLVVGRKDKSKDFEPGNVMWMTHKRQSLKKADMREVTIAGVTKQLCQWAESSGISKTTLHWRLDHWPEERWLDPPKSRRRRV